MKNLFGDRVDYYNTSALISHCSRYRYWLRRAWPIRTGDKDGGVCFIGLNPSTADARDDDPTIRRCVGFTKRWGYSELLMLNLFAYRSTDPKSLLTADDPVGEENDGFLTELSVGCDLIVLAWGALDRTHRARAEHVAGTLLADADPVCLGRTKAGDPRHPLYLPSSAYPILWKQ